MDGTFSTLNGDAGAAGKDGAERDEEVFDERHDGGVDAEGFRVEHRYETEQMTQSHEVRELPGGDATELRRQERRELTLEELKSRECVRPATLEELRALMEAEFDRIDEIEISRDVLVEDFTRIETTHERKDADGEVLASTLTVTEEHKSEEINETPHLTKTSLARRLTDQAKNDDDVPHRGDRIIGITTAAECPNAVPDASGEIPVLSPQAASQDAEPVAAPEISLEVGAQEDAPVETKGHKTQGFLGFLKGKGQKKNKKVEEKKTEQTPIKAENETKDVQTLSSDAADEPEKPQKKDKGKGMNKFFSLGRKTKPSTANDPETAAGEVVVVDDVQLQEEKTKSGNESRSGDEEGTAKAKQFEKKSGRFSFQLKFNKKKKDETEKKSEEICRSPSVEKQGLLDDNKIDNDTSDGPEESVEPKDSNFLDSDRVEALNRTNKLRQEQIVVEDVQQFEDTNAVRLRKENEGTSEKDKDGGRELVDLKRKSVEAKQKSKSLDYAEEKNKEAVLRQNGKNPEDKTSSRFSFGGFKFGKTKDKSLTQSTSDNKEAMKIQSNEEGESRPSKTSTNAFETANAVDDSTRQEELQNTERLSTARHDDGETKFDGTEIQSQDGKDHKIRKRYSFGLKFGKKSNQKSEPDSSAHEKKAATDDEMSPSSTMERSDNQRKKGKISGFFAHRRNPSSPSSKLFGTGEKTTDHPTTSDGRNVKDGEKPEEIVVYSVHDEGTVIIETHPEPRSTARGTTAKSSKSKRSGDSKPAGGPGGTAGNSSQPDRATANLESMATAVLTDVRDGSEGVTGSGGYFVVVAIDFGTTFSGYAFSFVGQPDSIHMMRRWEGGDPGVTDQKTPTTILLTPDGQFHSFGFTARDFYHDLDPIEAKRWLYFEKFKMALHHNAVSD